MTEKKATATEYVLQHVGRLPLPTSTATARAAMACCVVPGFPEGGDGRTSQGRRYSGAREMAVTASPDISPKRVATLHAC
jgi:hypothetical protein